MRKSAKESVPLMVTQEAIRDFRRLNTGERLRWLDEMRTFLSQTLPEKTKRNWKSAGNPLMRKPQQLRGFLKRMDSTDIREKKDRLG